jgi:hypothetical protein
MGFSAGTSIKLVPLNQPLLKEGPRYILFPIYCLHDFFEISKKGFWIFGYCEVSLKESVQVSVEESTGTVSLSCGDITEVLKLKNLEPWIRR